MLVVTDRINLDKQIKNTIKQFMQVSNTVGWAILDAITDEHKGKNFAIIIDEVHSSQNGSLAAKMNIVVSGNAYDNDDSFEDKKQPNTAILDKTESVNC